MSSTQNAGQDRGRTKPWNCLAEFTFWASKVQAWLCRGALQQNYLGTTEIKGSSLGFTPSLLKQSLEVRLRDIYFKFKPQVILVQISLGVPLNETSTTSSVF